MSGRRTDRLADGVLDVLSRLLRENVRDKRIGFVTLTGVKIAPDLTVARVFVSSLAPAAERRAQIAALNHAAPFLRRELAREVRVRRIPELEFVFDDSLERGARVESLLGSIHEESAAAEEE